MPEDYDFDRIIDRRGTGSWKWSKADAEDVIPLGVADMDFASPPAVLDALRARVDHGVFGYSYPTRELTATIQARLEKKYAWEIEEEWIVWLPGLVPGLNAACRAAGDVGDQVLSAVPVYPPFLSAPKNMRRELRTAPLQLDGERWTFDFEALEAAVTPKTRLFMLCNPHNPVGRAFSRQELEALAEFCLRHDLVICADEIHCELILEPGVEHLPIATLSPEVAAHTLTFMSPSKTFNLAGIGVAFAIVSDDHLRRTFKKAIAGIVPHVNALGYTACLAAYRDGAEWHQALLDYLRGNRDLVFEAINAAPDLSTTPVEATYLAWIDTRAAEIENPGEFFLQAGVDMWDGVDFGGPGFIRINFGLPRSRLREGLRRIQTAMQDRSK
ncbi:MAG: PatB family C-S lyase [Anaerolineales bacterium]|jgi:cystathionine beta-lyase